MGVAVDRDRNHRGLGADRRTTDKPGVKIGREALTDRCKAEAIAGTSAIREELGVSPSLERPDIDVYWVDADFIEIFRPEVG